MSFNISEVFRPKFFGLFKKGNYNKETFTADLIAGIIVGIVALPLAIAFGIASGVSPQQGLITAVIAGFIVSLLGGSHFLIGGPTGAFIVIVYGIVGRYGMSGLIIATVLAGIILVLMGIHPLSYRSRIYQRNSRRHFFYADQRFFRIGRRKRTERFYSAMGYISKEFLFSQYL